MLGVLQFVEKHIFWELLSAVWLLFIWEMYLQLRQYSLMKKLVKMPGALNGLMTKDLYDKARNYALEKNVFTNFKDIYKTIVTTIFFTTFAYAYCYNYSIKLAMMCGFDDKNEIIVSGYCVFVMCIVSYIIDLPLKIYSTFKIEEKHGFNKETPLFFVKDQLKQVLVSQVITIPFMCGIIWIVKNGGDYFFFYVWAFTNVVTIFMLIVYPEFIAPLFDKYSPLPDGELKNQIEALAASVSFPLYKLFIVEGSKRSSHSNAYMYGFYKHKRIVLFDTLVKEYYKPSEKDSNKDHGCENAEVVAVLAHELGHWKYSHTLKNFALTQVSFVLNFLPFAQLLYYKPIYAAFGFTDSQPIIIGLIVVTSYVLMPINTLYGFMMTVISRKFEFQADQFAKSLGYTESLKRALVRLQKDNLSYPIFDKLYSSWSHTHPPLLERLEELKKED